MSNVQQILHSLRVMGLSQTEISRRTAIPQPRLSKWQAGAVPASVDDALLLLRLHEELSAATAAQEVSDAA